MTMHVTVMERNAGRTRRDGARWAIEHVAAPVVRLLVVATLVVLASCANVRGVGDPKTPTGGVSLEVETRDTEAIRATLYRVWPDGTIDWGGGRDAMNSVTTWEGLMGESEIAALRKVLEEDGWYDGRPTGTGSPKSLVATVVVRSPSGNKSYTIRGECPALDRLVAVLNAATKSRHDGFMRKLPEASPRLEEPDPRTDQL